MAGDFENDTPIFLVENSIECLILDYGALFHTSHSTYVIQNFRHYQGKVKLTYNKFLDIMGVRNMVLKTILRKDWTLKNVKFIL